MANLQNTTSYVKFVRGTVTAWNQLRAASQVYDDTLYFIYESADATTGSLYLGTKLIGGTGSGGANSLADLTDVIVSEISNKDILIYNGGSWINGTIEDIINLNTSTLEIDSTGAITIVGFTQAEVGTIPQKSSNNKITWTNPVTETRVTELINNATSLGLRRTIVGNLSEVTDESYIYMIPKEGGSTGNLFDEFILVNGQVEKIGDGSSQLDLTGYVTKAEFETEVNSLQSLIDNCVTSDTLTNYVTVTQFNTQVGDLNSLNRVSGNSESTIVDEINSINERLTWQAIVEEK